MVIKLQPSFTFQYFKQDNGETNKRDWQNACKNMKLKEIMQTEIRKEK